MENYTDTDYGTDARFKIDLIIDQLAAKEMSIIRFYMKTEKWIPALNRLKIVTEKYDTTVFVEEALHRLVEVYYKLGLIDEAKQAASILGYNYGSGDWYKKSYKVFNKKYKPRKSKIASTMDRWIVFESDCKLVTIDYLYHFLLRKLSCFLKFTVYNIF